jgi:hypothetical protein
MQRRKSDIWFEGGGFRRPRPITIEGGLVMIVGVAAGAGLFWLGLWLDANGYPDWLVYSANGLLVLEILTTWVVIATHTADRDEINRTDLVDDARRVLRERRDR